MTHNYFIDYYYCCTAVHVHGGLRVTLTNPVCSAITMMLVECVRVRDEYAAVSCVVGALLLLCFWFLRNMLNNTDRIHPSYRRLQFEVTPHCHQSTRLYSMFIAVVQDTRRAIIKHELIAEPVCCRPIGDRGSSVSGRQSPLDLGSGISLSPGSYYYSSTWYFNTAAITGSHSNQDPPCTLKPIYTPIFTNHIRS